MARAWHSPMLGQGISNEGLILDEWRLPGDEWRLRSVLTVLAASVSWRRLGVPRTCPGVGSSLAFAIEPSIAFGGCLFRATPGVLDLDLAALLLGCFVAALACIGCECWLICESKDHQGRSAEAGKRIALRKAGHCRSPAGGDGRIVRALLRSGQAGLPALVWCLVVLLHRE